MKTGTKSLLFGVHQVFLHPLFVLWGWVKLYGWPNWKELVCIIIHDWGYWGCGDMDGKDGSQHVMWAYHVAWEYLDRPNGPERYAYMCMYHSRFFAYSMNAKPSKLCWADKLGTALYPPWLWVLLGTLTGEIKEYMGVMKHRDCIKIKETNPFKYFKVYRDKVVPELLRENGLKL